MVERRFPTLSVFRYQTDALILYLLFWATFQALFEFTMMVISAGVFVGSSEDDATCSSALRFWIAFYGFLMTAELVLHCGVVCRVWAATSIHDAVPRQRHMQRLGSSWWWRINHWVALFDALWQLIGVVLAIHGEACSSNITPVSPSALRLVTFLVVWNLVKRGTCWSWFYMQFLRNVEHGPYLAAMQARRQLIFV